MLKDKALFSGINSENCLNNIEKIKAYLVVTPKIKHLAFMACGMGTRMV
jgi:hypothetical protein